MSKIDEEIADIESQLENISPARRNWCWQSAYLRILQKQKREAHR